MAFHLREVVPVSRLTNSAVNQVHMQGFELVHPNIYPIDDFLEYMKGLVLQNHGSSCMGSFHWGPVLIVCQKLTNKTLYSEHFQGKLFVQRIFISFLLFLFKFSFVDTTK
ncbi:hypothetical protein STEG23_037048, partial [Scotinomys teguina]